MMYSGEHMIQNLRSAIYTAENDFEEGCESLPFKRYSVAVAGCTAASITESPFTVDRNSNG